MRARMVYESDVEIGERKKQLLTGDIFVVQQTGNLNGNGDLFIRNEKDGKTEKCTSKDWMDPRKYSSVIIENKKEEV